MYLFERNEYNTMHYAIYKDKYNFIGFIGDCGFAFDLETLKKWTPIKIGYHIPMHSKAFLLYSNKEWIGFDFSLDTPIEKVIDKLKSTIDVIVAMTFAQRTGLVNYDSEE